MQLHKVVISILVGYHKFTRKFSSFFGITILGGSQPLPQMSSAVLGTAAYISNFLHLQIIAHAGLSTY